MTESPITEGILAQPLQPDSVCMNCGAWFALKMVSLRDDERHGSIKTYQCKKCDATVEFAERHPPDAV